MPARAVVVLPTYNEKENLETLIRQIMAADPAIHALVVDDHSPDGTGQLADKLALEFTRVHVLHRTGKPGRGLAGVDGFRWALDQGYEIILEMDADFSHDPKEIPRFLEAVKEVDVVIGSRFIAGGHDMRRGDFRRIFSKLSNALSRSILGMSVRDCTSGFRAFTRSALQKILSVPLSSKGPSIVEEILYVAIQKGLTMREIPIVFQDRRSGSSKLNAVKALFVFIQILKIRFSSVPKNP